MNIAEADPSDTALRKISALDKMVLEIQRLAA